MLGALQDRLSPVALTRLDQILKNTRFEFESRISALLGNQCGQRHNRIASQTKQCFCCLGQVKEESESGVLTKEEVAREKGHWGRVLFDRYMQYLLKNPDAYKCTAECYTTEHRKIGVAWQTHSLLSVTINISPVCQEPRAA